MELLSMHFMRCFWGFTINFCNTSLQKFREFEEITSDLKECFLFDDGGAI